MIKQNRIQFLGEVKAIVNEDIALENMLQKSTEQLENQKKMEEEKEEAKEILEQLALLLYNSISEYREQEGKGILKPMILSKSTINILSKVINSENYFISYFFERNPGQKDYFEEIINNNKTGIHGIYVFEVNTNSLNTFCKSDLNYFIYDKEEGKYVNKLDILVNEEI